MESASGKARLEAGKRVGAVAQMLFPEGTLIEGDSLVQALEDTEAQLLSGKPRPLFEATFEHEGVLVRVDLLLPEQGGYRLVEVKSSTGVKAFHLPDVALQSWVLMGRGVPVVKTELAHIDNTFVYPGGQDYRGLFHFADVGADTTALVDLVPNWISEAKDTLAASEPAIEPGKQCSDPFQCPFKGHCAPKLADAHYPPEDLLRGGALAQQLRAEGYEDLRQVPPDRLVNPVHRRIHRAVLSGKAELLPEAGEEMTALSYPRYYLDFETISLAVPVWVGTRPYQPIPFQWSCHIETAPGSRSHYEFLADGPEDPRREFAETLVNTLGTAGPIIVYNAAFERSRMRELAQEFPDLADRLESTAFRIFDLLPLARNYYYHRDMHGSWSIKAVLPTIAPSLDYGGLAVSDGELAQETFRAMLFEGMPDQERAVKRQALLAYCERDTLAMVRIAHYFQEYRNA